VYVRLAAAWTDPAGGMHGAGDVVDIDIVTLAELEEQGVVDNGEPGASSPDWVGPGVEEDDTATWVGPGDEPGTDDDNEEAEDQADQ
jgi:hypothetical protein